MFFIYKIQYKHRSNSGKHIQRAGIYMKRAVIGFLCGWILGLFGVFIFSNFVYMGISMIEVFGRIGNGFILGDISKTTAGFYEFFFFSFYFNFFTLFNLEILVSINFIDVIFPPAMGWFFAGLISGTIIKGIKRSTINSLIIVIVTIVLWLCLAIISGANLTFVFALNIVETFGGIVTVLISSISGGIIGGALSGKYVD